MTTQTKAMVAQTIQELSEKINAFNIQKKGFATQVFKVAEGYEALVFFDEDPHRLYGGAQ